MTKKFVLTAFAILAASLLALAQTEPQARPTAKPNPADRAEQVESAQKKSESDKVRHAEERSKGAAYSGKGEGGRKDAAEKEKRKKGKHKGKGKGRGKGKSKEKSKGKKKSRDYEGPDSDGDSSEGRSRPGVEEPKQPNPAGKEKTPGTPKVRRPGDRPSQGTEQQKDQKTRG
ncbi:MAG: hypothetical protein IPH12_16570 [Saprospirales bacterium]|nr:hypothetical protein [Saprospirales bacterium]